jgi:AcrR family transcriptional regulator
MTPTAARASAERSGAKAPGTSTQPEPGGPTGREAGGGRGPVAEGAGGGERPMRADAVRNRRRILEAAEEVFAERGVSVPIDDIAVRAGVGAGTLYRHFPTKEALIEAVVFLRVDELAKQAAALADAEDPGAAFFTFLADMSTHASKKQDLIDALGQAGFDKDDRWLEAKSRLEAGITRLLERARRAGAVRDDVCVHEVMGLVMGACMATRQASAAGIASDPSLGRLVEIICDGIRVQDPGRGSPPPGDSPTG